MSDQWGQQPSWGPETWGQQPTPNQQPQQLPSLPNQQPWGQSPIPNQQQWGQPPTPDQRPWDQSPIPNQQQWQPQPSPNQQQWGQPLPNAGWQQQPFNPGQFQPPQLPPKKKKNRVWLILSIIVGILVLCGAVESLTSKASNTGNVTQTATTATSTKVTQSTQAKVKPTATPTQVPTPTATPTPLPTPTPTETAAQIEATYKAGTTSTTVTNLDKEGSADQGENVDFTCTIVSFVKDSTGTTAGANVTDAGSYTGSFVQIVFPAGTDITQLNQQDTVEVWGLDMGTFSGTNAFGATVQEVEITALYVNDQTTNYQAGD